MTQIKEAILFIDDDDLLLTSLKKQLEDAYSVIIKTNPEEALAIIKTNHIGVALVDLTMPRMDGIQVMKAITDIAPATQKIVLTGTGNYTRAIDAINAGKADLFLQKPTEMATLKEAIDTSLARHTETLGNQCVNALLSTTKLHNLASKKPAFFQLLCQQLASTFRFPVSWTMLKDTDHVFCSTPGREPDDRLMNALTRTILTQAPQFNPVFSKDAAPVLTRSLIYPIMHVDICIGAVAFEDTNEHYLSVAMLHALDRQLGILAQIVALINRNHELSLHRDASSPEPSENQ